MATIEIENATVTRLIPNYGFEVAEEIQLRSGDTIKAYYTIWNKDFPAQVGDLVTVQGVYSAKIDEYTDKTNTLRTKISVSVNNAEVMSADANAPF